MDKSQNQKVDDTHSVTTLGLQTPNSNIIPSPPATDHFSAVNQIRYYIYSGKKKKQKQQGQVGGSSTGKDDSRFKWFDIVLIMAILILLVALLVWFVTTLTQSEQSKVMVVGVNNSMPDGSDIRVHCASKAADFGKHVVPFLKAQIIWFDPSASGNARFQCRVTSTNGSAKVDAFVRSRDQKRCQTMCAWFATPEGVINFPDKGPRGIYNMLLAPWTKGSQYGLNLQKLKVNQSTN